MTHVLTCLSTVYAMSHEYDVGGGQVFNLLFISQVLAEGLSTGKEIERPPILFKL